MVLVPVSKAHPTGLLFNRSKAHDDGYTTALYRQYLCALIISGTVTKAMIEYNRDDHLREHFAKIHTFLQV